MKKLIALTILVALLFTSPGYAQTLTDLPFTTVSLDVDSMINFLIWTRASSADTPGLFNDLFEFTQNAKKTVAIYLPAGHPVDEPTVNSFKTQVINALTPLQYQYVDTIILLEKKIIFINFK